MHLIKTSSPLLSGAALVAIATLALSCGESSREEKSEADDIMGVVLLDNCEDGNNGTLENDVQGFFGYWYSFDDKCECDNNDITLGTTTPLPGPQGGPEFVMTSYEAAQAPAPPLEGEQTETYSKNQYGARISGGQHNWFGAGVGVALNNAGSLQVINLDPTGVTAVRFQARNATGAAKLKVRITDSFSEPLGGKCVKRPDEDNRCEFPGGTMCRTQGCFDHAVAEIDIDDQWRVYEVPFTDMSREGWGSYLDGVTELDGVDTTAAYQLQFAIYEDTFDLWLDNIGFVVGGAAAAAEPAATAAAGQ